MVHIRVTRGSFSHEPPFLYLYWSRAHASNVAEHPNTRPTASQYHKLMLNSSVAHCMMVGRWVATHNSMRRASCYESHMRCGTGHENASH
jgi:hypothetical protein